MGIIECFTYDEVDGVTKFNCHAIEQFLLNPRYQAVVLIRLHREFYLRGLKHSGRGIHTLKRKFYYYLEHICDRLNAWNTINYSPLAEVGRYVEFANTMCIGIGHDTKIGSHCHISARVGIGEKNGKYPVIGDNVYIGTGALILGDVKVGNNVTIGTQTLIIKDIPDNSIVVSENKLRFL